MPHGNIVMEIVIPWSIGMVLGGFIGGEMLKKMSSFTGPVQQWILRASFIIAIIFAGYSGFQSGFFELI